MRRRHDADLGGATAPSEAAVWVLTYLGKYLLIGLLVLTAALPHFPPIVIIPGGIIIAGLILVATTAHQAARWMDRHRGEKFRWIPFVGSAGPLVLMTNALAMGALLTLANGRVQGFGEPGFARSMAFAVAGVFGMVGLAWSLFRSIVFGGNPWFRQIQDRGRGWSFADRVRESVAFQRFVAPRIAVALARIVVGVLLALSLSLGILTLAVSFGVPDGVWGFLEGRTWYWWANWLGLAAGCLAGWSVAVGFMGGFRVVQRSRRAGTLREGAFGREVGLAVEALGFWPTVAYGMLNVAAVVVVALVTWIGIGIVLEPVLHEDWQVLAVAAPCVVLAIWFAVLLPQLYVFPVLTRRDCGWSRAVDASFELVHLDGLESLANGALFTVLALTGVGIPGAVHFLLCRLDRQELLLAAILGEKSPKEVEELLAKAEEGASEALVRPNHLLEKGRYLDALNAFQLYRFNNPRDPQGLRGEALAMLMMGHVKAREVLERWASEDPESLEAASRLAEFQAGEWGPTGTRFLEAQRRCTQPVGRGV